MRNDFLALLRGLGRTPVFTLVSVLTLGIALGGTTAISSFLRGILLAPLPYQDAERLVTMTRYNRALGFSGLQVWGGELFALEEGTRSFSQISGIDYEDLNLRGGSGPEKVTAGNVLPDLLPLLGLRMAAGRAFHADETEGAVILTHRLWVSRFGASPHVVGSRIRHDRGSSTVVGILAPEVEVPLRKADLLLPMDPGRLRDPEGPSLAVFARLAPGAALETARAEVDAVARRLEAENDWPVKGWYIDVTDLRTAIVGEVAPTLWMLQAAVLLVLLIACANFAGLLLARGVLREKELAVRRAMGAGRLRLARLLLVESVFVAAVGGLVGLVIARWGTAFFLAIAPDELPRSEEVAVDVVVLGAGLAFAVLSGIVAGAPPALLLSREAPRRAASKDAGRLRAAFTVVQIGVALTLAVGCGLLARSVARLASVDPGFESEGLLTCDVSFPQDRYPDAAARSAVVDTLIESLRAAPEIRAVGVAPWTLLTGSASRAQMSTEEVSGAVRERSRWPIILSVSPGFFPSLGIPLLAGRGFEARETGKVAIVNRALAERAWPGGDAVGRRIKFGRPDSDNPWLEIVGVVETARLVGLARAEEEALFDPLFPLDYPYTTLSLLVRTRSDAMSIVPRVRAAASEVDRELPLSNIQTMEEVFDENVQGPRFRFAVVVSFTALAVGLAGLGIYGVVAQWTAARRREIGIRMALGADRRSVVRLVVEQGFVLAVLGTFLGVLGSLAAGRFLEAFLYEVSSFDPLTLVLSVAFFAAMALAAALLPARSAASVDPADALRAE